ncbi:hypothetical protein TPChic_0814a [Treponema pallidum subsp. pallidum str. Chicago]|nr:hypothetical protein TPChic_0814a [Treponema pallidum subsp. pallidum str. Chicago]
MELALAATVCLLQKGLAGSCAGVHSIFQEPLGPCTLSVSSVPPSWGT